MRYLGLDLGSKTLGIAVSDRTNTISQSVKTIFFKENDYNSLITPLKEIINEYDISAIVLGLPKNMNNTLGPRAEISIEFKKQLEENLNIKVILMDERLTTIISNNIMIEADISRKKRKKKVDAIAASLILQTYLDTLKK